MSKRAELKRSPIKATDTRSVAQEVSKPPSRPEPPPTAPAKVTEPKQPSQQPSKPGSSRHAPLLPAVKPPSPAQIQSSTAHALQRKKRAFSVSSNQSNPGKVYDIVKKSRSREPAAHNNRKKTDITHYADAVYAGGVFKNAPPGQSM